jgi:GTP pyrophosphokinase
MTQDKQVRLAEKYCIHYHEGQFRKGSNEPYATHPFAVRDILSKYGYNDPQTQCIALLHDTREDTEIIIEDIKKVFGFEIAHGVYVLSNNTIKLDNIKLIENLLLENIIEEKNERLYLLRLALARKQIQRIKIADMIHNTRDLITLTPNGIAKKIKLARSFYIPLGKKIAPIMIKELEQNIKNYEKLVNTKR